jgi:hypothetical protein
MVRVGIGLSALVVIGWILASIIVVRSEDTIPPWVVILIIGGWAFVALILVWAGVGFGGLIRRSARAGKAMRNDDSFAKPS